MAIAYWIVASALSLFYLYSGAIKVVRSRDQLRPMMEWVDAMPMRTVRIIGGVEVLGAIGLILPPATGIGEPLAMAAAIGFVLLQIGATALHIRRHDTKTIAMNLALIVLAAVTAWLATALF